MSYILDALKKIESEKRKKVLPDGRINISGDLFQERKQPKSGGGIWKIATVVVVASLLTAGGTWYFLRKGQRSSMVVRQTVVPPPIAPVRTPTPTPVSGPGPVPPSAVSVPSPVQSQPKSVAVPALVQHVAPPVQPVKKETEQVKASLPLKPERVKKEPVIKNVVSAPTQTVQTVSAPADIKLSGIAWQDEHSARRAVINGFLIKEGTVVSGATITDIQTDRVRFLSPVGMFEIRLDSISSSEVKK